MQPKQTDKPPVPGTAWGLGSRPRCKHGHACLGTCRAGALAHHPALMPDKASVGRWPQARRAVATPIARPVTTAACAPCGARSSVVGRQDSSSRTSRTSSSSSSSNSDKTRQGKTTHVFPVIPRRTDTLGKFRTYKNTGRHINVPKHVFQNTTWKQHAPTSRNLSPQLSTQQSKWTHCVSKWGVYIPISA